MKSDWGQDFFLWNIALNNGVCLWLQQIQWIYYQHSIMSSRQGNRTYLPIVTILHFFYRVLNIPVVMSPPMVLLRNVTSWLAVYIICLVYIWKFVFSVDHCLLLQCWPPAVHVCWQSYQLNSNEGNQVKLVRVLNAAMSLFYTVIKPHSYECLYVSLCAYERESSLYGFQLHICRL